jgi:hypothetical protein
MRTLKLKKAFKLFIKQNKQFVFDLSSPKGVYDKLEKQTEIP